MVNTDNKEWMAGALWLCARWVDPFDPNKNRLDHLSNISRKHKGDKLNVGSVRFCRHFHLIFSSSSRLTSLAMDSLALLTSSPSFLLRYFFLQFLLHIYVHIFFLSADILSTWSRGRDRHQPEAQEALGLLQALCPRFTDGFKMRILRNITSVQNCLETTNLNSQIGPL